MSTNEKNYFDEREEEAFLKYISSDSEDEKNKIYNEVLITPFRIMSQSILRLYPIHPGRHTLEEIEHYAMVHLIANMYKFNPDAPTKTGKKTKAYSYCQTIIRNFYRDHSTKTYKDKMLTLSYDEHAEDINENIEYSYELNFEDRNEYEKLIDDIVILMEEKINVDKLLKKNEILVGYAIIDILKNWHILFIEDTPEGKYNKRVTNKFQKNKILFFLKEQTNLNTKEIRLAIKPYKDIYFFGKSNAFDE
jgi:hypothetical protein